ncbi:NnrU family protein [Roseinatronobacter alkalisoli]|uniref:NnrU family protein n=1 Tax=Roseinatronobacter alkalisoli TaxID=3028235 RepID=A0ABT5T6U4_9RHOB|nr:NnrU family protein [Roseinatronobacter sp. HJB301]MDD7970828.1 NnrU family protein [Roseinatronobacter sp. HJB301]
MTLLILGLILFLGVHSVRIVVPDIRARIIARGGGRGAWMWPYTGVAGAGFVLIILGYALARYETPILYTPLPALRHLALVVMLPVFPLLLAAYLKGRIGQIVSHPMLVATMLWGVAHLMANGTLADLLLFGGFLVWAILNRQSLIRREGGAAVAGKTWRRKDAIALVGGLALYLAFIGGLHALLFGVSPI